MLKDYILVILTGLLSGGGVVVAAWANTYFTERAKRKRAPSIEDKSMCYLEMDKICSSIRTTVKADGSYLAYFHNGGVFSNGISMDKFTVVGEDYNDRIRCLSYKKSYNSTMINYMSYAYHRLLVDNKYLLDNVDNIPDLSYKSDLSKRKVVSMYMYLIKDPVSDKPIGFFALEYVDSYVLTSIEEMNIWKQQNRISKLLNITVIKDINE